MGLRSHAILCDEFLGGYDKSISTLIGDASLQDVRSALRATLLKYSPIDEFTIYFAGHGIYRNGSFFLCTTDTNVDQLSQTAFAIAELFTTINEAGPRYANIIIDACQAGGSVADLGQLLKPEIFGPFGGPSISFLAAAAADQAAYESQDGGLATAPLLEVLSGKHRLQTSRPYFDLVEIGQEVSRRISANPKRQRPAVWGFNLSGEARFSKNPHYEPDARLSGFPVTGLLPTSEIGQKLSTASERLWRLFIDLSDHVEPRRIVDQIWVAARDLDPQKSETSSFVSGLAQTFPVRAALSNDVMAESEVLGSCIAALLPYVEKDPSAASTLLALAHKLTDSLHQALTWSSDALKNDKHALLSTSGGLSDLFFLPLRISKLLGYIGIHNALSEIIGRDSTPDLGIQSNIVKAILNEYQPSLVCVSDTQAPYLTSFFTSKFARENGADTELLFSCYSHDLMSHKAQVIRPGASGNQILRFLLERHRPETESEFEHFARPSELLASILILSVILARKDTIDPFLADIDHQNLNFYLPDDYQRFSRKTVDNGVNITLQVGLENEIGIFSVDDLEAIFRSHCSPRLRSCLSLRNPAIKAGALVASILFPDRVCWFLVDDLLPTASSIEF